eukprot:TRINITY_DN4404_c0_g2_i1.p1 TRINITY_DN4404_c0_g2~~TRINITY_DN4404_c0_g2_i1.p1  ORF type:complete len:495 (-),score=60.12 TRINITY_DN4404_c0_g2_i1:106-1590(-)
MLKMVSIRFVTVPLLLSSPQYTRAIYSAENRGLRGLNQRVNDTVNKSPAVADGDAVLETRVADWNDLDLVLEESDGKWHQIPEPFFRSGDPQPYPPLRNFKSREIANKSTIVVLIAALREPRTVQTLVSLFSNADLAQRVHVGVVQQNDDVDVDALKGLCDRLGTPLKLTQSWMEKTKHNQASHHRTNGEDDWGQDRFTAESLAACVPASRVRVYRMSTSEAAGPVFARSHQPLLLSQGDDMEDFCLQIDAHTIFTKGWDTSLVEQWASVDNDYAVISTYPTGADLLEKGDVPNVNKHWEMPHLCNATIVNAGIVRNSQAGAAANLQKPALSKFWAAGLSFSRCHAERDVPGDPNLKQIFNGEEFSRGARLWTNGYDFYSLARPVLGTYYGDDKGGLGGWNVVSSENEASEKRLRALLASDADIRDRSQLDGYDVGKRRHLQDYFALTGVNTRDGSVRQTPCMVTKWTKWLDTADPPYTPSSVAPPFEKIRMPK